MKRRNSFERESHSPIGRFSDEEYGVTNKKSYFNRRVSNIADAINSAAPVVDQFLETANHQDLEAVVNMAESIISNDHFDVPDSTLEHFYDGDEYWDEENCQKEGICCPKFYRLFRHYSPKLHSHLNHQHAHFSNGLHSMGEFHHANHNYSIYHDEDCNRKLHLNKFPNSLFFSQAHQGLANVCNSLQKYQPFFNVGNYQYNNKCRDYNNICDQKYLEDKKCEKRYWKVSRFNIPILPMPDLKNDCFKNKVYYPFGYHYLKHYNLKKFLPYLPHYYRGKKNCKTECKEMDRCKSRDTHDEPHEHFTEYYSEFDNLHPPNQDSIPNNQYINYDVKNNYEKRHPSYHINAKPCDPILRLKQPCCKGPIYENPKVPYPHPDNEPYHPGSPDDDCLKIWIEYEFNHKIICQASVFECVDRIVFKLHSVTKNVIVKSAETSDLKYIFLDVPVDKYMVTAEVYFVKYECKKLKSRIVDVIKHLNHKSLDLKFDRPCCHFEYGKKYRQKHVLYENVKHYMIEIGLSEKGGYEEYLKDKKLRCKYKLVRVYCETDCYGYFGKYMSLKYRVVCKNRIPRDQLINVANYFESLDYVDYVSLTPRSVCYLKKHSQQSGRPCHEEHSTFTPDFQSYQAPYLSESYGLNVIKAWEKKKAKGGGTTIRYIGGPVNSLHEDLIGQVLVVGNSHLDPQRGTATAGLCVAKDNKFGITGIANEANFVAYDNVLIDDLDRIANPGDILVIGMEFHRSGFCLPVSENLGIWQRIQIAQYRGALILQSAGTGGVDLSSGYVFIDHGDNGVLTVGSAETNGHRDKITNFNHASSAVSALGDHITTTGYGDLFDEGEYRKYTQTFGGPAAALGQVAGAISIIHGYLLERGISLNNWEMRKLLLKFGYNNGATGIGVRPNVFRILEHFNC